MYNYLAILLISIVIILLIVDWIPQFYTWQSRIHIGRYQNKEMWKQSVLKKSIQWLKKTPTIKLTDNKHFILIDILKGNYKRNAIQHWQEAALLLGLTEYYIQNKDIESKKEIDIFLKTKFKNGNWINAPKEIDGAILAYAVININWIDHNQYKPAYDSIYKMINELIGVDGTVQYRNYTKDYRFVDTIGFICPFLIMYGLKFNEQKAIDLAVKQITTYNNFGMLNNTFIPCHTYNVTTKLPVGLFGWGRGLGWYAIGLIDSWKSLPDDNLNKKLLEQSVITFAKTAIQFQNENGSWSWLVLSKESRFDSSATATLTWFIANASTIDEIKEICLASKEKSINYLLKVTRRDGAIDFSQGDTKAIGVHSQEFDILPFTQGFALRVINL